MCFADRDEFQAALVGLKLPYADEVEITDMLFDSMDFDGGGTLSQDEVVRYALLDILGKSKDRIRNLCKLWDADLSGTICLDEFRRVMNALGMEVPVATIDQLFADLDEDRTGELVYESFARKLAGEGSAARSLAEAASESKPTTNDRLQGAFGSVKASLLLKRLQEPPSPPKLHVPSSSMPPSDDDNSDDDTFLTPRSNAAEGKALLRSFSCGTRLQDAATALEQNDVTFWRSRQDF